MLVVDAQGNKYEATYPKRAKGLVKCGRARFVDENTICLACPPKKAMEDNEMTDQNKDQNLKTAEEAAAKSAPEASKGVASYTLDYALSQLEAIRRDNAKFSQDMMDRISDIKSGVPGDVGSHGKSEAFKALVLAHDEEAKRLTDFYLGMIRELKSQSAASTAAREQFYACVKECVANNKPGAFLPDFEQIWAVMSEQVLTPSAKPEDEDD